MLAAFIAAVLAATVGLLSAAPASAVSTAHTDNTSAYVYDTVAYTYDAPTQLSTANAATTDTRGSPPGPEAVSWGSSVVVVGCCVAPNTGGVDIAGARFAQTSFSERFSSGGLFSGQTIDDVAGALRSGASSPKDVPINVVVRDGNTLITNTRSAQALTRAGIPRDAWNVINRTGDSLYEELLSGQLTRNGLTSGGTALP